MDEATAAFSPEDKKSFLAALDIAHDSEPHKVGLIGDGSYSREYFWWRFLPGHPHIAHVQARDTALSSYDMIVAPFAYTGSEPGVPASLPGFDRRTAGNVIVFIRK